MAANRRDTASAQSGPGRFRLGRWIVEPDLNLLRSEDEEVPIEPRLMNLLTFLAMRPGELALKDHILESVWGGVSATDESLSQAISKLRRLLGDDPDRPTYIETIRKKGYRLLAAVESVGDEGAPTPNHRIVVAAVAVAVALLVASYVLRTPNSDVPNAMLNAQPITSMPGRERDPAISADGQYVVYAARMENGNEQIYLHGIGRGTGDRQLTRKSRNQAPVFFPDGEKIAFLRRNNADCAVMLITLIDGAERVLGDCSGNDYGDTAMAPDGRSIAFNSREAQSGPHAIYVMDVESGRRRALTSPPARIWGDYDPVFSANGQTLVFARSVSEGMQDLYSVSLDTGRESQLTGEGRNIFGVALFGDRVYYGTNRNGRYEIWSVDLNGQQRYQLPISSSGLVNPSVSLDGSRIVFEVIEREVSFNAVDFGNPQRDEVIFSFNADILHPDVSPVTDRLIFSSNRSGHYEIWDSDRSGADLRRLTNFSAGFTAHPKFSPDGRRIAFDARPTANARIYVMNQDGSELHAITAGRINAYAPTWSRDGKSLYYSAETDDTLQVWQLDLASGHSTQVTTAGGIYAIEGPDGYLYHVRPERDGIWRIGAGRDHEPERVLPGLAIADWGNWTMRDKVILFYDRQASALRSYRPDGGTLTDLAAIRGTVPTADPSVVFSASEDRAYVGLRTRFDSDLEIVVDPFVHRQ